MTQRIIDDLYTRMLADVRAAEVCWAYTRNRLAQLRETEPDLSDVEVDIRLDGERRYTGAVKDTVFFMGRAAAYAAVHDTVLARMLHGVRNPDGRLPGRVLRGQRGDDANGRDEQAQAERRHAQRADPGREAQADRRRDE